MQALRLSTVGPSCISALDYCCFLSSPCSTSTSASVSASVSTSSSTSSSSYATNSQNTSSANARTLKRRYYDLDEDDDGHQDSYQDNTDSVRSASSVQKHHQHHQRQRQHRQTNNQQAHHRHRRSLLSSGSSSSASCGTTGHAHDPTYLEDDKVFYNLILKETSELERRHQLLATGCGGDMEQQQQHQPALAGQLRHSLLSWMLKVCEHQLCQDEIFPLATMILDKFLVCQPQPLLALGWPQRSPSLSWLTSMPETTDEVVASRPATRSNDHDADDDDDDNNQADSLYCDEHEELGQRQLYLFAACALLLATKLRQTPRLGVQTLIEFSRNELPVELSREEILDGELLVLATLKWDLAALVTPNDFLGLVLRKCQHLLSHCSSLPTPASTAEEQQQRRQQCLSANNNTTGAPDTATTTNHCGKTASPANRCDDDESRVRRHTQTLLELCLMDSQLSQFQPSILAMASMAVAIDGLSITEKTCWRLNEIVGQIHEATHKVNELKLMIDVAFQIEKYVQKLLRSTHDD